ncbi:hypothetical protein BDV93DRAFT_561623 [Ceratobasidium sp. AG-I]|nr:hypothetical protein BDV93DRAFT_561623 [Ceratobasidium sp. AG-I]
MPKAHYRPAEVALLRGFLEQWTAADKRSVKQTVKGQTTKKQLIVWKAIDALFEQFPDRHPKYNDPNEHTYTSEQLLALPEKIRQWFKNNIRDPTTAIPKPAPNSSKNVTARMLFMSRYAEDIRAVQKELTSNDPDSGGRGVWNQATTSVIERYNKEQPEVYQGLQNLAKEIRAAGGLDFVEQDSAVIQELLKRFPQTLHDTVHEWTRTTGVTIYALAVFEEAPGSGIRTSQAVSPTIQDISTSRDGKEIRQSLTDWIISKLGAHLGILLEDALPMVYPDATRDQQPSLPQIDPTGEDHAVLISWFRVYINYLWAWQGGVGKVPWGRIAQDQDAYFIDRTRQPLGVTRLIDPGKMQRPILEGWYAHILSGQDDNLLANQIFQFRHLDEDALGESPTYEQLCTTRHPNSRLRWLPAERLYALRVQSNSVSPGGGRRWSGLPPARLQHLYEPFDPTVSLQFESLNKKVSLLSLVHLVEDLCRDP